MATIIVTNDGNSLGGHVARGQLKASLYDSEGYVLGFKNELTPYSDALEPTKIFIDKGLCVSSNLMWEQSTIAEFEVFDDGDYWVVATIDLTSIPGDIQLEVLAQSSTLQQDDLVENKNGIYQHVIASFKVDGGVVKNVRREITSCSNSETLRAKFSAIDKKYIHQENYVNNLIPGDYGQEVTNVVNFARGLALGDPRAGTGGSPSGDPGNNERIFVTSEGFFEAQFGSTDVSTGIYSSGTPAFRAIRNNNGTRYLVMYTQGISAPDTAFRFTSGGVRPFFYGYDGGPSGYIASVSSSTLMAAQVATTTLSVAEDLETRISKIEQIIFEELGVDVASYGMQARQAKTINPQIQELRNLANSLDIDYKCELIEEEKVEYEDIIEFANESATNDSIKTITAKDVSMAMRKLEELKKMQEEIRSGQNGFEK